jgi:hypothetical protein
MIDSRRAGALCAMILTVACAGPALAADGPISIRTEGYPRPPYSGATYYIYEQAGRTICTKLEVCNKFNNCETTYRRGTYKDPLDVQTGAPYDTTPAQILTPDKLSKHACLTRFGLR